MVRSQWGYHACWMTACILGFVTASRAEDAPSQRPPNVIFIVADTLRADHLSCYGYDRETSPFLDALAGQSTVFDHSISTASYTLPAHASLFTGQLPMLHMAQTYINSDGFRYQKGELVHRPLAPEFVTLAEAFQEVGYRTAGFAANTAFLHPRTGLAQGFQDYHNKYHRIRRMNQHLFPWLEQNRSKPLFLFVNYMDTHKPYNTNPVKGFLEHVSGAKGSAKIGDLYATVMMGREASPDQLRTQKDIYDLSIRNLDEGIGELMNKLRALDLFDNSLIVFTSDHGEFLGEHQYMTHWKDVYEEVVHVPLIIKNPHQKNGARVTETVSTMSVAGFVLNGVSHPALAAYREQFSPRLNPGFVVAESRFCSENDYYGQPWANRFKRVRYAAYDGAFKYIYSTDGNHAYFDLRTDPSESHNLLAENPAAAQGIHEELEAVIKAAPTPITVLEEAPPVTNESDVDMLKDLGYL